MSGSAAKAGLPLHAWIDAGGWMRRIGLNAGSKFGAELAGRALQFVLVVQSQRVLGVAAYGEFTFALAAGFVLATFADLGLALIVTRDIARDLSAAARTAGAGLALKFALSLAAAAGIALVALSRAPDARLPALLLGLSVLAASFVDFVGYTFRGLQHVAHEALLTFLAEAATALCGLWVLGQGGGLAGLAWTLLLCNCVAALLGYAWLCRRFFVPRFAFERARWSYLARQALPLGGAIVLSVLYTRTAVFMLDRLSGAEAVGLYGLAQKFTEPMAILPAACMAAVFPAYVQSLSAPGQRAHHLRTYTPLFLLAAGAAIAGAWLAGGAWLLSWLYGPQYAAALPALQLLALALVPSFVNYALTHFLIAAGRQRLNLLLNAVILAVNALLCALLIPRFGTGGAAAAMVASEIMLFAGCWLALAPALRSGRDARQVLAVLLSTGSGAVQARGLVGSAVRRATYLLLLALAMLLPFELKSPLLMVGPYSLTNVELVLYALLALWGLGLVLARRAPRWSAVHTAVAAWAGVLLLSALFAPAGQADAVKFALRSLGGCALFFAVADRVHSAREALPVLAALALGALASAVAGLAENWLPGAGAMLLLFKTQPSLIGNFLRAGGTFVYANVAAMYWEAALPLVIALIALRPEHGDAGQQGPGRARLRLLIGVTGVLVVLEALILSASRAALAMGGALLAAMALAGWARWPALRRPAAAGLLALAALTAANTLSSPLLNLRLRSESDTDWFRAEYRSAALPAVQAGQAFTTSVAVRNAGVWTWPAGGEQAVYLSYHWTAQGSRAPALFDGRRTPLPHDLAPGEALDLKAAVVAPASPGRYFLQWDLVQEHVTWFSTKGNRTGDLPVEVLQSSGAPASLPPPTPGPMLAAPPGRVVLWGVALRMWREHPLLGIGPGNFRHLYGAYLDLAQFDDRVHANSLYFETLADLGLLGIAALLALPLALLRPVWRTLRSAGAGARAPLLVFGVLLAVAAFYAHGVVDYFMEFTATYGLFWLLAGMLAGLAGHSADREVPSARG